MKENRIANLIFLVFLWVFSIIIIYPFLMILLTSFKSYGEAVILNISLPKVWHFTNYLEVWTRGKIFQAFINSSFVTIVSVIILLLLSSMMSFIITRRQSKFDKFISRFITFGIIAPFAALPTVQLMKILHLYGSRLSLILVYSAIYLPFSTMLFSSFIYGIPREMDEAAVVDGYTGFNLFIKIIFPLLQPVVATTSVLNFMWVWNDFQYPLYLLNSSSKWTLPLSVYNFFGSFERSWHLVSADMILVSLPVIILYLFAQKYIITGMTAGAVKG